MLTAAAAAARSERDSREAEPRDDRSESPPPGFRGSKRRQVKKACAHCRKGHRCCEEQRPCKRCRRKGLPCDDGEPQKPRFKLYPNDLPPAVNPTPTRMSPRQPAVLMWLFQCLTLHQPPQYPPQDPYTMHLLLQQAQQHQRYVSPLDGEMSLTDTIGMNFRAVPALSDLRALPSPPPFPSAPSPSLHWISTRPNLAIPTPVSLTASTEQHQNLVQSINSLRTSIPLEQMIPSVLIGRPATEALIRSTGLTASQSVDPPPGVTTVTASAGLPQSDGAFDVLRNSFFSLGEPKADLTPQTVQASPLLQQLHQLQSQSQQQQLAAQQARLHNPLLHTASAAFLPPPASLPGLNQRITSLTTSAPPTFFVSPARSFAPIPGQVPSAASVPSPILGLQAEGSNAFPQGSVAKTGTDATVRVASAAPRPSVASSASVAGPLVDSASL